ncbi:uncharacterized protein JCM6883_006224 [Sporobolomyces salmoneus]|uniref:uncharacterized protein n=1 Tax=Sporobolomyces salmoneus TaxID=183962 RepID=UPI0031718C80
MDPLPTPYFLFFSVVEPFLTYLGAAYAVFTPVEYFVALYPPLLKAPPVGSKVHPASVMATRQLGSCFFLFALMGSIMLPRVRNLLKDQPRVLESFVQAYLGCLALADLTHIGFTLYDLGLEGTLKPSIWNQLVFGNVVITLGLFVVRMMWFAGVARSKDRKVE